MGHPFKSKNLNQGRAIVAKCVLGEMIRTPILLFLRATDRAYVHRASLQPSIRPRDFKTLYLLKQIDFRGTLFR